MQSQGSYLKYSKEGLCTVNKEMVVVELKP